MEIPAHVAFAARWDMEVESVLAAWTRKGRVVRLAGIENSRGARCWVRRATRDRAGRIVEIGAGAAPPVIGP